VAVRPDRQRRGIGGALVAAAITRLRETGAKGCVVLGDPDYYGRFGFEHDPKLRYGGAPAPYFQRILFDGASAEGEVRYHPAFGA
jgi:putative acetyltransferase